MNRSGERHFSLDALRGLAVAGMLLVNLPGGESAYAFLRHAPWHGMTGADLVFPAFLVALGASAAVSLGRRREAGERPAALARRACARAAGLFALGLVANAFELEGGSLRLPGVLQRIAACYLACVALFMAGGPRLWGAFAAAVLGGYAALLGFAAAPGCAPGTLTPACALPVWLDAAVLGPHRYLPLEPEGLLSTLPAAATAALGMLAGEGLRRGSRAGVLLAAGLALGGAGLAWSAYLPLNKVLWTSSFALLAGGASVLLLGALKCLPRRLEAVFFPMAALGRRALAVYVLSGLAYGLLGHLPAPGSPDLKGWLMRSLLEPLLSPPAASLAFSLAFVAAGAAVLTRIEGPRWARAGRPSARARSRRARRSPPRRRRRAARTEG